MGTEDIRIENGRFQVERPVEHKENIDVDLSEVEQVYFERSKDAAGDGALVLTTRDGASHLVRVSNEDDDKVLSQVYEGMRGARKDASKNQPDLLSTLDEKENVAEIDNTVSNEGASKGEPGPDAS